MELIIGKPYLRQKLDQMLLCAQITMPEQTAEVWFSVESEYARYLTSDRADAFLVGCLPIAMTQGLDIRCHAPVTRRLYYQITQYLIPAMAANMERYHFIQVDAPVTDEKLPCAEAVGTGWTGGVDSMYTLMTHMKRAEPDYQLSHLLVANVGTLESDHNTELLQYMSRKTRQGIAAELNLSVVAVDSNIQLLVEQRYLSVAVFRLPAAVLALQSLFGVFLHSGAYEFSRFSFVEENSAYYELLPLSCFETDTTVFYSTGSQISRIQKLKELSEFSFAQKYLHPCIYAYRSNCGRCGKCVRTEAALYALGTLEKFGAVFDLEDFSENREMYLPQILMKKESQHYGEVVAAMKQNGMEFSPDVQRKARILRAAAKIVGKNSSMKKE